MRYEEYIRISRNLPIAHLIVWQERLSQDFKVAMVYTIISILGLLVTLIMMINKVITIYKYQGVDGWFYACLTIEICFCLSAMFGGWLWKRNKNEREYVTSMLKQKAYGDLLKDENNGATPTAIQSASKK